MQALVTVMLSMSTILIIHFLIGKTVFGLRPQNAHYLGVFLYIEVFFLILPALTFLNLVDINQVDILYKVSQTSTFNISLKVLGCINLFFLTFFLLAQLFRRYMYFVASDRYGINSTDVNNTILFVRCSIFIIFALMGYVIVFLGANHSFFMSLISGESISGLRFNNQNNPQVRYLNHLFICYGPFLSTLAGSNIYDTRKRERFLILCMALVISSFYGSKGPVIIVVVGFLCSYFSFHKTKISFRNLLLFILTGGILIYLLYFVVKLQYSWFSASQVFIFLANRIFIGQMAGTYEQFNLLLQNPSYWFHAIPFASLFKDYPIFHKDLMMISEDVIDASTRGVKNTFFIAEAYALGGNILLLLSPILMAINIFVSYVWLVNLTNHFIFHSKDFAKTIIALYLFSYISLTGGFSDIIFYKITILITIFLLIFIIPFILIKPLFFASQKYRRNFRGLR